MKNSVITRKLAAVTLLAISMAFGTFSASAVPLTGAIGFGGLFNPTGGTDLGDATGLDIYFSQVTTASGDFVPAIGNIATFSPFDFNPASTPVTPLWSVLGYSFDLEEVFINLQNDLELNLSGTGTMMAAGFDDTDGEWTFSGDSAGGIFFTFSSIATTRPVAEPGTALLLGLGLIGMGIVRRRFKG